LFFSVLVTLMRPRQRLRSLSSLFFRLLSESRAPIHFLPNQSQTSNKEESASNLRFRMYRNDGDAFCMGIFGWGWECHEKTLRSSKKWAAQVNSCAMHVPSQPYSDLWTILLCSDHRHDCSWWWISVEILRAINKTTAAHVFDAATLQGDRQANFKWRCQIFNNDPWNDFMAVNV